MWGQGNSEDFAGNGGWGVPQDKVWALILLHSAAEVQEWEAQVFLAGNYLTGDGVQPDLYMALH